MDQIITKRQKQVLDYIKGFRKKWGYAPSYQEIIKHLGLSSVSTAHHHVKALKALGLLKKEENQPRAIDICDNEQLMSLPLLGTIAAGEPIEAIQEKEIIAIPKSKLTKNGEFYALRVSGSSMIDENINDGDIVIVKSQPTANNGDKVVALIDNQEVTLKKLYKDNNSIRLQPANPTIDPLILNPKRVSIQGIVVEIIKSDKYTFPNIQYSQNNELIQSKHRDINYFLNKVHQDDCLKLMKTMPPKSIDMVLCDLPYGNTQNKWDSIIPLDQLWVEYERIIKDNGVIALTSQGIFTAQLILSNPKLFKYKIVWVKSKPTNFLNAKKQPLRRHEDVCIFYKNQPDYNPQMTFGEPYNKGFRKNQLTGCYGDFSSVEVKSDGQRYPTDVVYFKTAESEGVVHHPTQKPIELGRYLIKTFTKPGNVVLDNTCGSGSFLVSAVLEDRSFIGIEKNEEVFLHKKHHIDYIDICNKRIKEAKRKAAIENSKLFA